MAKFKLTDGNIIIADQAFIDAHYPDAVEVPDTVPTPAPAPTRRDEIITRLAQIDALGDSARARREALLGNTAWLAALDAEAATLRAELATL